MATRSQAGGGWRDDTIRLWHTSTRELKATLTGHTGGIKHIAFSPDGNTLAIGSGGTVKLWEVPTGEFKAIFAEHGNVNSNIVFSPDGSTLANGSEDGR